HTIRRENVQGRRQQTRLLLNEYVGDPAAVVSGPAPLMGHLVAPLPGLAVAFSQCCEGPAGPEGIANVADSALNAPFLIPGADLARFWHDVVVRAHFEQARMKEDLRTAALQYG